MPEKWSFCETSSVIKISQPLNELKISAVAMFWKATIVAVSLRSPLQPLCQVTGQRATNSLFFHPSSPTAAILRYASVYADDEVFIEIIGKSPSVQIQAIRVSEGGQIDGTLRR